MKKIRIFISSILIIIFFSFGLILQAKKIDEESTKLIKEYTTSERFLNELIDHIPQSEVPSPRDVLGYIVGTPKKLTYYGDIIKYMKTLAEKSKNVEIFPIGETNEGRIMYIVVVASEETIQNLDEYKAYTDALADPRETPENKAKEIIKIAKPIYYISCNLHSWETGSAEMSMELAYRLAVSDHPFIKTIRENCIVLITPSLEPDGHDRFTNWYYRYTKDITDERSRFPGPPYWGKYVFHDNNRDITVTQNLTKNVIKTFLEWYPQVTHDLHESIPYLYISTGTGPYYPSLDPIVINEWQWLAHWEVTELTKMGMPGVWTHGFYTGWYPGYLLWVGNLHNAIGRFYETFGNGGATTMERTLKREEEEGFMSRFNFTRREWYRPWPPDKKITWSIRNNINYQQSGVLAALNLVALNRETILYNFWKKAKNAIEKGKNEPPYAWIIPTDQKHPVEMTNILNLLMFQGVEIHQVQKEIKVKEGTFPKGSYIIRMDQPYRVYAKTMLEVQNYPPDAGRPYDDATWTLGYMYDVKTVKIDDPKILNVPIVLVKYPIKYEGKIFGRIPKYAYVIPHQAMNNLITVRILLKNYKIYAAEKPFEADKRNFPAGSFILIANENKEEQYQKIASVAKNLGLTVYSINKKIEVEKHELEFPRVALYHTWIYTQDSGWVRFTFDQYQIPYKLISKDRLRKGNLKQEFDVILIPHQSSFIQAKNIVHGIDPALGPIPYNKTDQFKYIGDIDQSEDITGGMGFEGLLNLQKFVNEGGMLITLGSASKLPLEFGLVRHIEIARTTKLLVPGSILKGEKVKGDSPILYGYEKNFPIYHGSGFMFRIPKEEKKYIIAKYADSKDLCLSGLVKGEKEIKGKAAIVDVPINKGHIVMFNFNPLHRFQTKVDFMLVFNILLNYNHLEN